MSAFSHKGKSISLHTELISSRAGSTTSMNLKSSLTPIFLPSPRPFRTVVMKLLRSRSEVV